MSPLRRITVVAALLAAVTACSPAGDGFQVADATYRPPLGASDIGVGYLKLTSAKDDRIIAVSSPDAAAVEIHATVKHDGTARMERLDSLDLKAGRPVVFESGGMHLMVISPHPIAPDAIKAGSATFPVEFILESGGTKIVRLSVGTARP